VYLNAIQAYGQYLAAIRRTVNLISKLKWIFRGAGDGNRTRMTSLEGVWRTRVRAVELETLMILSSRGYPLLTMVNGPVMARRS
jgi:hypothetical protein